MAAHGIVIEVIGDATSYLRTAESTIAVNKKLGASFTQTGVSAKLSADAQVAASLKATETTQAQIVALRELATSSTASAATRERAALLATDAETRLARAQGLTVLGTRKLSSATKEGEKDLNKLVRGGLAGSGALSELGRSLAFASSGFIAFAIGAGVIKGSIAAAQDEAVAQRQVARQLQTSGKSWQQYGAQIDSVLLKESHLAGFTKAELLQAFGFLVRVGGNVQNSLKLTGLAADISRARNISLAAASIALSKALGGSATALRRLGIIVPKSVSTTAALAFVTEKFAGQAKAGTTVTQRFHATLVDAGAVIGRDLLPTFNRLTSSLTDWLAKMTESGRLQKNINTIVSDAGDIFHAFGGAIHTVDEVTGSFKNTLEILLALRLTSIIAGWIGSLEKLAGAWRGVGAAATTAATEEKVAAGTGLGTAAAGAGAGASGVVARVGAFTGAGAAGAAAARSPFANLGRLKTGLLGAFALGGAGVETQGGVQVDKQGFAVLTFNGKKYRGNWIGLTSDAVITPALRKFGRGGDLGFLGLPASLGGRGGRGGGGVGGAIGGPFGTAKPISIFSSFTDPIFNQIAQARAALTKSTADDVAAAKQEIRLIKRQIAAGHLQGPSLVQALSAQAGAVATIQQAEAAAVQAQTAKIEAAIDPVKLEVGLARAQLSGSTPKVIRALKALRAAAQKMLDSGKLSADQQLRALQQIISLNQQIKDAATQTTVQFQIPAKLAFRLARDTALGRSTTKDLLSIRKAILRFIATHKHNLAALTDAYNQLADINQQLGSTAGTALGLFKQASTRALTQGLGLTDEQRKRLRARLSQLGPGGTVPGQGVGAAGFVIGPDGRPIQVHGRGPTIRSQDRQTVSPARFNRLLRTLEQVSRRPIRVVVDLDGKIIADNTTRHQQRGRNRNSSQRRGPNAGVAGA